MVEGRIAGPWVRELRRAAEECLATPPLGGPGPLGSQLRGRGGSEPAPQSGRAADADPARARPSSRRCLGGTVVSERCQVGGAAPGAAEATLLDALRRGDDAAYETLVRQNSGRMLAVARRYLRNEETARDAVQEAFVSAFRSIARFQGASSLSTWLHRIVVNACLMKLRSGRRHAETSIEELLPQFDETGHRVVGRGGLVRLRGVGALAPPDPRASFARRSTGCRRPTARFCFCGTSRSCRRPRPPRCFTRRRRRSRSASTARGRRCARCSRRSFASPRSDGGIGGRASSSARS